MADTTGRIPLWLTIFFLTISIFWNLSGTNPLF